MDDIAFLTICPAADIAVGPNAYIFPIESTALANPPAGSSLLSISSALLAIRALRSPDFTYEKRVLRVFFIVLKPSPIPSPIFLTVLPMPSPMFLTVPPMPLPIFLTVLLTIVLAVLKPAVLLLKKLSWCSLTI